MFALLLSYNYFTAVNYIKDYKFCVSYWGIGNGSGSTVNDDMRLVCAYTYMCLVDALVINRCTTIVKYLTLA